LIVSHGQCHLTIKGHLTKYIHCNRNNIKA